MSPLSRSFEGVAISAEVEQVEEGGLAMRPSTDNPSPRNDPEFISVPEFGKRLGISKDSAYKAARSGEIPGCFPVGRLYRINWTAFCERSAAA